MYIYVKATSFRLFRDFWTPYGYFCRRVVSECPYLWISFNSECPSWWICFNSYKNVWRFVKVCIFIHWKTIRWYIFIFHIIGKSCHASMKAYVIPRWIFSKILDKTFPEEITASTLRDMCSPFELQLFQADVIYTWTKCQLHNYNGRCKRRSFSKHIDLKSIYFFKSNRYKIGWIGQKCSVVPAYPCQFSTKSDNAASHTTPSGQKHRGEQMKAMACIVGCWPPPSSYFVLVWRRIGSYFSQVILCGRRKPVGKGSR